MQQPLFSLQGQIAIVTGAAKGIAEIAITRRDHASD